MNSTQIQVQFISTFVSQGNRPSQEDYLLMDQKKRIFVVADGFGGPIPGAAAAQTACEAVKSFLFKEAGDLDATLPFVLRNYFSLAGNVLFNSLIHANRKLNSINKGKNINEKGGASVIAGFVDGTLLALANVGVCSAHLIRQGERKELVTPRSLSKLCDPFLGEESEDLKAPLISLGTAEDLEPELFEYRIQSGDWLILHTDGLKRHFLESLSEIQLKKFKNEDLSHQLQGLFGNLSAQDNASISLIVF